MHLFPLLCLLSALAVLLYAKSQHSPSGKGGIWVKVGSGLLLIAIVSLLFSFNRSPFDSEMAFSATKGNARGYVIGQYLAEQHAGSRVLILTAPENYPGPRHPDMIRGLEKGMDKQTSLVKVVPLAPRPNFQKYLRARLKKALLHLWRPG